jgi:hypothetical protein
VSEALRVTFVLDRADLASVAVLTEALTRLDELARARRGSYLPPLYGSGVRYEAEPMGVEEFPTTPILYERQAGDCAPLAAARASELRADGYPLAVAFPVEAPSPAGCRWDRLCPREIHVLVTRDGTLDTIEDPSAILGMRPVPPATLRELARASHGLLASRCGVWR